MTEEKVVFVQYDEPFAQIEGTVQKIVEDVYLFRTREKLPPDYVMMHDGNSFVHPPLQQPIKVDDEFLYLTEAFDEVTTEAMKVMKAAGIRP